METILPTVLKWFRTDELSNLQEAGSKTETLNDAQYGKYADVMPQVIIYLKQSRKAALHNKHSFAHSLTYSFTDSFIHSFIYSLSNSFTHLLLAHQSCRWNTYYFSVICPCTKVVIRNWWLHFSGIWPPSLTLRILFCTRNCSWLENY